MQVLLLQLLKFGKLSRTLNSIEEECPKKEVAHVNSKQSKPALQSHAVSGVEQLWIPSQAQHCWQSFLVRSSPTDLTKCCSLFQFGNQFWIERTCLREAQAVTGDLKTAAGRALANDRATLLLLREVAFPIPYRNQPIIVCDYI